ncbi:MAG: AAA family ATPase, partial [Flavobacteriales bacterium]
MKEPKAPLAERMRPQSLDAFSGQLHLVGEDAVLRRAMKSGTLPSMILWGPPGVGKTTLARLIAKDSGRPFHALSAIHSGVKDVRAVLDSAKRDGMFAGKAVLFIDEIHRFSKSQQDSLLGAVEAGTVTLIGATTENPSFEVIPALRSRCQVYVLESLSEEVLLDLVNRALAQDESLSSKRVVLEETKALMRMGGGDARRLLNTLELVVDSMEPDAEGCFRITDEAVQARAQHLSAAYDKTGEAHYDVASAMIKSIRASDPNAAVYYLARMVEGGE